MTIGMIEEIQSLVLLPMNMYMVFAELERCNLFIQVVEQNFLYLNFRIFSNTDKQNVRYILW